MTVFAIFVCMTAYLDNQQTFDCRRTDTVIYDSAEFCEDERKHHYGHEDIVGHWGQVTVRLTCKSFELPNPAK